MRKEVLLVDSPSDTSFQNVILVPGPWATHLYSNLPESVKDSTYFIDGNLTSEEEISDWISEEQPKIVGISSLVTGYGNAIKIGKRAKEYGAKVVLGGRHASDCYERILPKMKNGERPFDNLVVGPGQNAFSDIVSNNSSSEPLVFGESDYSDILDYSLFSKSDYGKKLMRIGEKEKGLKRPMSIISQFGCPFRCKFCSIGNNYRRIPSDVFEESLTNLINQTDSDYVYLADSNMTYDIEYLRELSKRILRVKENVGRDFKIYGFSRIRDINRETIDILKDTGVVSLFVGYEHGNNDMLRRMGNKTTREENIRVTEMLADEDIEIPCAGMVLGAPGETSETLADNISFAEEIRDIGNVGSILISPVFPFIGSSYWNMFTDSARENDKELYEHISKDDVLDVGELAVDFNRLSHTMPGGTKDVLSFQEITDTINEVHRIVGKGTVFTSF